MRIPAAMAAEACILCVSICAGLIPHATKAQEQGNETNTQTTTAQPNTIRVGGNVMQAQLLHMVQPNYPPAARKQGVSGSVVLQAIIARDGSVRELQAVSGPQILIYPAETAVKQWQYRPYLLNGQPVEVETTITVNFALDDEQSGRSATPFRAQNPANTPEATTAIDPQFKANILKLLDVTHAMAIGQQAAKTMFAQLRPTLVAPLPPTPHREQIVDAYAEKLTALLAGPEVVDRLAGVYARHLSPEDVNAMIQFYATPAGQHALASMPQIMAESQQIGANAAQENIPRIFGELCTEFPELRGKVKFCAATTQNESSERIGDPRREFHADVPSAAHIVTVSLGHLSPQEPTRVRLRPH